MLTGVGTGAWIVNEEIFSPVVTIVRFTDEAGARAVHAPRVNLLVDQSSITPSRVKRVVDTVLELACQQALTRYRDEQLRWLDIFRRDVMLSWQTCLTRTCDLVFRPGVAPDTDSPRWRACAHRRKPSVSRFFAGKVQPSVPAANMSWQYAMNSAERRVGRVCRGQPISTDTVYPASSVIGLYTTGRPS